MRRTGHIAAAVALAGAALAFSTNAGAVGSATVPATCVLSIQNYGVAMTSLPGDMEADTYLLEHVVLPALVAVREHPGTVTALFMVLTAERTIQTADSIDRAVAPWAQALANKAHAEGRRCRGIK